MSAKQFLEVYKYYCCCWCLDNRSPSSTIFKFHPSSNNLKMKFSATILLGVLAASVAAVPNVFEKRDACTTAEKQSYDPPSDSGGYFKEGTACSTSHTGKLGCSCNGAAMVSRIWNHKRQSWVESWYHSLRYRSNVKPQPTFGKNTKTAATLVKPAVTTSVNRSSSSLYDGRG